MVRVNEVDLKGVVPAGCEASDSVTGASECLTADAVANLAVRATASADVETVVVAAEAFAATLSSTQQAGLTYDLSLDNADNWSNLPVGNVDRNGLGFDDLSDDQLGVESGPC
jgi:hypothetical protein